MKRRETAERVFKLVGFGSLALLLIHAIAFNPDIETTNPSLPGIPTGFSTLGISSEMAKNLGLGAGTDPAPSTALVKPSETLVPQVLQPAVSDNNP